MAKHVDFKKMTPEQRKERKETLSKWHNPPGTRFTVTASGLVTALPTDIKDREEFVKNDLRVDGAEDSYQLFLDAIHNG